MVERKITLIEIISSGQSCIADVSQDSKPLEKFLMACVNVPIHKKFNSYTLISYKIIIYTYQEQVEEHLELKLSPNFDKIESQQFLRIVAMFCTLIMNTIFLWIGTFLLHIHHCCYLDCAKIHAKETQQCQILSSKWHLKTPINNIVSIKINKQLVITANTS